MKIKIVRSNLVEGLAVVKDACEGKDALNILRCVKLATGDKEITLTASNLDITVTTKVACEVMEPGEVALVGSSLFGFANALPEGEIEIELKEGATKASITGGSCKYALAVGDLELWPKMAALGGKGRMTVTYSLGSMMLKEIFRKVKYAASTDTTRRNLAGVNLATKNDTLTAVATDGRRLSCVEMKIESSGESNYTLTTKTVQQLEKMIGKEEITIDVVTDGEQVLFSDQTAKWTLQSKLIADMYPNWRQVVPKEMTNTATVDRGLFKDELGRVALSAEMRGTDKFVKITLDSGKIVLESSDNDYSRAKTELPVKYAGEKIVVSLNPDLVKDILGCIEEDDIEVAFGSGTGPIAFKAQIPFIGIVMPLRQN